MSKEEKSVDGSATFLNRGKRHYDLAKGADGQVRRHAPGATMLYSADEVKQMSGYSDLVDISKLPGQVDTGKLKAENARMLAENAALKAQLEALTPAPDAEAEVISEKELETSGVGRKKRA